MKTKTQISKEVIGDEIAERVGEAFQKALEVYLSKETTDSRKVASSRLRIEEAVHQQTSILLKDNMVLDPTMVIKEINEIAADWQKKGKENYNNDLSMEICHRDDARDLGGIARLIKGKHFKAARDEAARLDTIIREMLPDSFFSILRLNDVEW